MPTVKVTATGKAAHSGNHHAEGKNAIWALSLFILRAKEKHQGVQLVAIEGGQSRNTVPDHAELTMVCDDAVLADLDLESQVEGTTLTLTRSD